MLTILAFLAVSQYPQPEPQPTCKLDPAVLMVFKHAAECPTHTLRFEYRDDGTFRVVCLGTSKTTKLYPKRASK
jgi:hypothetical protein